MQARYQGKGKENTLKNLKINVRMFYSEVSFIGFLKKQAKTRKKEKSGNLWTSREYSEVQSKEKMGQLLGSPTLQRILSHLLGYIECGLTAECSVLLHYKFLLVFSHFKLHLDDYLGKRKNEVVLLVGLIFYIIRMANSN